MRYLNFNGKLVEEGSALVTADSRGLRYGDGLFETMFCTDGNIIFEKEHLDRLWNGMQVLQFEIPGHFTKERLLAQVIVLCKKNGDLQRARIRLCILRGDGGLFDARNHVPNYIIQSWPLGEETGKWNSNGLVTGIYTDVKKSCDILANIKHNNYLPYIMAALHAKSEKWNDAIILNTAGKICDSTIANIFLVKDEVIYTPQLSEGCVAGIMRKMLVRFLTKTDFKIKETVLSVDELMDADEVFFTNSIYNIRWVQRIEEKQYAHTMTQKIYNAFVSTIR